MATATFERRFCDVSGAQKGVMATQIVVSVEADQDDPGLIFNTTLDLSAKTRDRLLAAIRRVLTPSRRAQQLSQRSANPSGQDDGDDAE